MSSFCFLCELPILSHQPWGTWPASSSENSDEEFADELELDFPIPLAGRLEELVSRGNVFHEECLACDSCGVRLADFSFCEAKRFHNRIYCQLHYADVAGLARGEEFVKKLRRFKKQSHGCAEARRKSSTTLIFPVPAQACPGSPCTYHPNFIRATPGYWIECSGDEISDLGNLSPTPEEEDDESETFCKGRQQCVSPMENEFQLTLTEKETYEKHFYVTEHWNYFTNDEDLGPVVLSFKQENITNRDQFRIMLRTVSYTLHGLVPASCVCADRYDREAVVRALGREANLNPPLTLGQLPSTPDELLKLDKVFIKSELKVGVIYVKEDQVTEEQMLNNKKQSILFQEFLMVLGDRVRLKGFDKYKGGLDTVHDLTGTESIYTSWKGVEIMFHVSTLLPYEEDDTQQVSVVSRDEVRPYEPNLRNRSVFEKNPTFREWLLTKIVNGEKASYTAPKFARMQDRTRSQMLEDVVTNLQNHAETGQIPKPYRRGSWRPIGHTRPSSPLLDSVRDSFEGHEQLAKDFTNAFQANKHLCDVVFNVGQGKQKKKIYAVRALLGVRSRVFLEMLYGFTTGFGPTSNALDPGNKTARRKSSNFLQVPQPHEPRNKSVPSSPMVFRAFSRLGSWAGWGMSSRSSSKDRLSTDSGYSSGGPKRWHNKSEKDESSSVCDSNVALSMCADSHKVDRNKLCQSEFDVIEFDSETFHTLIEYLHTGTCVLTCNSIPGLICAAEHYDLPELLQSCFHHAKQNLRLSVVCSMLNILENYYWRYNSASELVNMILTFTDTRATQLFPRQEFFFLSESMFQMVIAREMNIPEVKKFEIILQWAKKKIQRNNRNNPWELHCIMNRLTRDLKLYKIPPQELIKIVLPTKTISNERILETLLYQADMGIYRIQPSYLEECRNAEVVSYNQTR
ncbi:uncharacterized protein LOC143246977 isoform X2 [Tachypleus tridentatus]|uniref:uncharacterized protein LOC143246977 isoform X2 n=1 Tax=Tachypleus tridentatus TaxID=6853 RepID=UPI003FD31976